MRTIFIYKLCKTNERHFWVYPRSQHWLNNRFLDSILKRHFEFVLHNEFTSENNDIDNQSVDTSFFTGENNRMTNLLASLARRNDSYLDAFQRVDIGMHIMVAFVMPNRPVRDKWEFPTKTERHFPITPDQPIGMALHLQR